MKVEIPTVLGSLINRQQKNRPNVIFAADDHSSQQAQDNIGQLYLYLAENYGLTIVGLENAPESNFFRKRDPKYSLKETAYAIDFRLFESSSGLPIHRQNSSLICAIANVRGYELLVPPAGSEPLLSDLQMLLENSTFFLNQAERTIRPEQLSVMILQVLNRLPQELGRSVTTLLTKYPHTAEGKQLILSEISNLRTNEQMQAVAEAMEDCQKSLALVCRGVNHVGEFINFATNHNLGFAIFIPHGINEVDPKTLNYWRTGTLNYVKSLLNNID